MNREGVVEKRTHELIVFEERTNQRYIDLAESSLCNFNHNGCRGEQFTREQWLIIKQCVQDMNLALRQPRLDEMLLELRGIIDRINQQLDAHSLGEIKFLLEASNKSSKGRKGVSVSICAIVTSARKSENDVLQRYASSPEGLRRTAGREGSSPQLPMHSYNAGHFNAAKSMGTISIRSESGIAPTSPRQRGISAGQNANVNDGTGLIARQSSLTADAMSPARGRANPSLNPHHLSGHQRANSESGRNIGSVSPGAQDAGPIGRLPSGPLPHEYENTVRDRQAIARNMSSQLERSDEFGRPIPAARPPRGGASSTSLPLPESSTGWFHDLPITMEQNARREHLNGLLTQTGDWVLRYNNEKKFYIITLRYNGENKHFQIYFRDGIYYLTNAIGFNTILELLNYYRIHNISEFVLSPLRTSLGGPYAIPVEQHVFRH